MSKRCKDCVFDSQNKLREVVKDVISCIDNEHTRLEQRLIAAEQTEQEGIEIVAELKAENVKLKESNENLLRRLSTKMLSDEHYDIRSLEVENLGLAEENKKLKDEIEYLHQVLLKIKDIAMCGDCDYDCDNCMQGQIDKLIKEALNGRKD